MKWFKLTFLFLFICDLSFSQIDLVIQCARESPFVQCAEEYKYEIPTETLVLLEKYFSIPTETYVSANTTMIAKSDVDSVLLLLIDAHEILSFNKGEEDEAFGNFKKALSFDVPRELEAEVYKNMGNYLAFASTDSTLFYQYVEKYQSICYDPLDCFWSDFIALKYNVRRYRIEDKVPPKNILPYEDLVNNLQKNQYNYLLLDVLIYFASYYAYYPNHYDDSIETNRKAIKLAKSISPDVYTANEFLLISNIANGYMKKRNYALALKEFKTFDKEVIDQQNFDNQKLYFNWISQCYTHLGEPDSAIYYSTIANEKLKKANNLSFSRKVRDIDEKYKNKELTIKTNKLETQQIYLILAIIVFSLISIITFALLNNYRLKKKVLEESLNRSNAEAQLKTLKALTAERTRIAGEMHDDLGGGLTTIKFLSQRLQRKIPDKIHKTQLNKIVDHSQSLVNNMSEIIWAMNAGFDTLLNLVAYSRRYAFEYLEPYEIDLQFDVSGEINDIELTGEKRRNLFLVIKEALHNVVKYSEAKTATISFDIKENNLHLTISDNGVGFGEQINQFGNGLNNMKERILSMNGKIDINGKDGVRIEIWISV